MSSDRERAVGSGTSGRAPHVAWWLMLALAVFVGGYALFAPDGRGARATVFGSRLVDQLHFGLGAAAVIVGPFAFRREILRRRPGLHRAVGYCYAAAVSGSGACGVAMALVAHGGITSHLGFGLLGVAWLATTAFGLVAIGRGYVIPHRRWMVRSYALCYAAVTLRLQLGPLIALFGEFDAAYQTVAWSCWIPNLVFAEWWLARTTLAGRWRSARALSPGAPGAGAARM